VTLLPWIIAAVLAVLAVANYRCMLQWRSVARSFQRECEDLKDELKTLTTEHR